MFVSKKTKISSDEASISASTLLVNSNKSRTLSKNSRTFENRESKMKNHWGRFQFWFWDEFESWMMPLFIGEHGWYFRNKGINRLMAIKLVQLKKLIAD